MRKVHVVLRLFFAANMSIRAIARAVEASPSTIGDYVRRARVAGLGWPLPDGLSESALEALLFPPAAPVRTGRPLPVWSYVHAELRRKGVTLALLWQEYKTEQPTGVQYSQFCEGYRAWAQRIDTVMRQSHRAGEKLFVDYAGHTARVSSAPPAKNAWRKCSWRCSARPANPTPRPLGRNRSPIGRPRTCARWLSLAGRLRSSCPIIYAPP